MIHSNCSHQAVPQEVPFIVDEFHKLLSDFLHIMPGLCPVLGILESKNWHGIHLKSSRGPYCLVDEIRALTPKPWRNNCDGPQTLVRTKVTDLVSGIQTDGFD